MITFESTRNLARSAEEVFNVLATRSFENHPKWEDEVIAVRRLTPGPMSVGSRAIMVREERRKRRDVEYEVTEYVVNQRIAYRHLVPNSTFELIPDIRPVTATSCEIRAVVSMGFQGVNRLLEPLVRRGVPKKGEKILDDMKKIAETEPVVSMDG